jgi:hypothetical protein
MTQEERAASTTVQRRVSLQAALLNLSIQEAEVALASLKVWLRMHLRRESAAVKDLPIRLGRRWQWEQLQLPRGDPQMVLLPLLDRL